MIECSLKSQEISKIRSYDNPEKMLEVCAPSSGKKYFTFCCSKSLLPEPYRWLMTDSTSPIIEYYPEDFRTDLNGKAQEWEAVVLIPFIAEVSF